MYDDDLFNMLNSYTATETDEKTYQDTRETPQQFKPFEQIKSPYIDDYSTSQNFEEERSYNSRQVDNDFEENQTSQIRQMHTPVIMQSEKSVKLTKTCEKLYLSPRLKIAASFCLTIFMALVFVVIYNFAWAANANSNFAAKEIQITEISQSINNLEAEYNELANSNANIEDANLFEVSIENFYSEPEIEKLPSNWFNDVCEFFSSIFA